MKIRSSVRKLTLAACVTGLPALVFAQDPLVIAPQAYKVWFENEYVQIVHVHYGPKEKIPVHDHTALSTTFVYLNDSGPVVFNHIGADYSAVTRSPTQARAFRTFFGLPEVHEVINNSDLPSDFLRVQFKTQPRNEGTFRGRYPALSYPPTQNFEKVQVDHDQVRITRVAIAPGKRSEIVATVAEPALLVAVANLDVMAAGKPGTTPRRLTLEPGKSEWVAVGEVRVLENRAKTPAEFLRFDFKTEPMTPVELARKTSKGPQPKS